MYKATHHFLIAVILTAELVDAQLLTAVDTTSTPPTRAKGRANLG